MSALADVITKGMCRVQVFEGGDRPDLVARYGAGVMLTLDMPPGDARHAEVYLDADALQALRPALRGEPERRLGYRRPTLCVGHEIAPNSHPEDAEVVVAGYSFCYPCGNTVLAKRLSEVDPATMTDILRLFRDGLVEIAP